MAKLGGCCGEMVSECMKGERKNKEGGSGGFMTLFWIFFLKLISKL